MLSDYVGVLDEAEHLETGSKLALSDLMRDQTDKYPSLLHVPLVLLQLQALKERLSVEKPLLETELANRKDLARL